MRNTQFKQKTDSNPVMSPEPRLKQAHIGQQSLHTRDPGQTDPNSPAALGGTLVILFDENLHIIYGPACHALTQDGLGWDLGRQLGTRWEGEGGLALHRRTSSTRSLGQRLPHLCALPVLGPFNIYLFFLVPEHSSASAHVPFL